MIWTSSLQNWWLESTENMPTKGSVTKKRYYRRPERSWSRKKKHVRGKGPREKPRIDPGLKPAFQKIGVPESEPFEPDPFQIEALHLITDFDVLVSAPTGAGKTWIASQTIEAYLSKGLRVWYASPLKALSNSIYRTFSREFGPSCCGILTGDRKENPEAPVIVGTTEILRNQLYDAMDKGSSIRTDLVILDEAHYLSDPDRGVVWEETLIYLPPRVRLLLLSATISNADEVCTWLEKIRGGGMRIVFSDRRPVPLKMVFLFPDGLVVPLGGKRGVDHRIKKFYQSGGARGAQRLDFGRIIRWLRELDLLPVIFFLKSRADCDRALGSCPPTRVQAVPRRSLERVVSAFLEHYPHLRGHRQMKALLESRVASHHAGQLPYWKMLVEEMMNKGLLEAIFSTSTVAAGVNFPARTVALMQSDRYNGYGFVELSATDLHQMIGRAGRRGKDKIGFALLLPGPHQDVEHIHALKNASPEPLVSRIHINFSMTLNLLLSHEPQEVKELLDYSFGTFQERQSDSPLKGGWNRMLQELVELLPEGACDVSDPYEVAENVQKRLDLKKELKRLRQSNGGWEEACRAYLAPGRLFLHRNGHIYMALGCEDDRGRLTCLAQDIHRIRDRKRGRPRPKHIHASQIEALFDHRVDLSHDSSSEDLWRRVAAVSFEDLKPLSMPPVTHERESQREIQVQERLRALPCEGCPSFKTCAGGKRRGNLRRLLMRFRAMAPDIEKVRGGQWLSFKRHVRFLKETGFVAGSDRLTPDGLWASQLRLDQPLLIAEAIRKGAFHQASPSALAGGIAPFVWDRSQEVDLRVEGEFDLRECESTFQSIRESIQEIRDLKGRRGFHSPPILFWPALALYLWAKGCPWEELLAHVSVEEGDMASLISRTADHLRQVSNLKGTHPGLASVAETAIGRVLREPVYIE